VIPGFFLDQTFLGLGQGKLFPARERLVSDIPAGDGNIANLSLQCITTQDFIRVNLYNGREINALSDPINRRIIPNKFLQIRENGIWFYTLSK